MGLDFMDVDHIPHLTSPLKGEEQDKLAHMRLRGNDAVLWIILVKGKLFAHNGEKLDCYHTFFDQLRTWGQSDSASLPPAISRLCIFAAQPPRL